MPEFSPPLRRIDHMIDDIERLEPSPVRQYYRLDPKVRFLWMIGRGIFWVFVNVMLLVLLMILLLSGASNPGWVFIGMLGLSIFAMFHVSWPLVSYRHWSVAIRHSDVLVRSGVWWKRIVAVPFSRIQHVDSHSGPIERSFGLANLVIHTAGSQLGAVGIPGLPERLAEELRDYLSRVGHTHANL